MNCIIDVIFFVLLTPLSISTALLHAEDKVVSIYTPGTGKTQSMFCLLVLNCLHN